MFRRTIFIWITLSALLLSGCAFTMSPIGAGAIVTNAKMPVTATSNKQGSRVGYGKCSNILGLVLTGDCSISSIAKANGITSISSVDNVLFSVLVFYSSMTVTVTGE